MDLLVVESPTKAKTISRFLNGKFEVLSTMGHIRDLPTKKLGIEIVEKVKSKKAKGKIDEYDFKLDYEVLPKKKDTIKKLKDAIKKAGTVYLATDPDREGEAIAWHVLAIGGVKKKADEARFRRVVFHEITESAIREAMAKPGQLDMKMVDAQQARRVLDRLVGYKLSPLLWQKIRRGLSAGRVQSVAVRLIVDKEREIEKFKPEEYWDIFVKLKQQDKEKDEFTAKLEGKNGKKLAVKNQADADLAVGDLKQAAYRVDKVEESKVEQKPLPPFSTSTLQQAAARRFGFTAKRTMSVAQALYEKGLITYHRTDSFNLAEKAVESFRQYILKSYGKEYLPDVPNIYKTKSKVAQEAHEAIRPTNVNLTAQNESNFANNDEKKLYSLIWRRALACQMSKAIWNQLNVDITAEANKNVYRLVVSGRTIDFPGWLTLYDAVKSSTEVGDDIASLPKLTVAEVLDFLGIDPVQKFTQPPARYSEASLIKELEKKGIGRPSTYAPIVTTIQLRQYVAKEEGRFYPTPLGITVNDFLVEYFAGIVDYTFTAKMEDDLDEVANGKLAWKPMIAQFYGPFAEKLAKVTKTGKRQKIPTESTGEKCPKCGEGEQVIRIGRFGKFISCSRFPDCDYTAPYIEKVEGVKCPECGGDVVVRRTKKGRQFFGCSNWPKCKWASWHKPKTEETTVTMTTETNGN
jgi:DNA topoisomerase I